MQAVICDDERGKIWKVNNGLIILVAAHGLGWLEGHYCQISLLDRSRLKNASYEN